MLATLRLILPVLVPSWRFFASVGPSPRIELQAIAPDGTRSPWVEYRRRPAHLPPVEYLRRLIWNPDWNETLYLVALAERIAEAPSDHARAAIARRIARDLAPGPGQLRFRLVFLQPGDAPPETVYTSDPFPRRA